jgi:N-acetylmuramoyl-L-alanine amidase
MRKISHIVVHCSATAQNASVAAIQRYWKENLGWKSPGYHYIIEASGNIVKLLDEAKPSNGVAGHNDTLINVCYIGGVDAAGKAKDTRTEKQRASLLFLLEQLKERYPSAAIWGHHDFPGVKKACPSFDAKAEYKNV